MINDVDKLYLPAEFIARHDVALCRLLAEARGKEEGRVESLFPRLELAGEVVQLNAINISSFRYLNVSLVAQGTAGAARIFRSSGTSAQGRSLSSFSEAGLAAYQSAITDGFTQTLKSRGADPKTRGISLIPPTADWPESSLAAMVEWLGEAMPVAYLKVPDGIHEEPKFLHDFRNLLKNQDSPVWIFGTSFHFVPLIDRGLLPVLPRGSLAFYTGGTKGKVRDVGESWLIDSLERGFRIPRSRIVSEYGMSELASAAYTAPGPGRALRFQKNVVPFVVNGLRQPLDDHPTEPDSRDSLIMTASRSGTGLLGVFDFNRVDIPAPIVTEDVVRLAADGSFELLGRAHTAPLKGCSMLVEGSNDSSNDSSNAGSNAGSHNSSYDDVEKTPHLATISARASESPKRLENRFVLAAVEAFIKSHEALDAMVQAIESRKAAKLALDDLLVSITKVLHHQDAWMSCMAASGVRSIGKRLLIIPPNSHPLAVVYPMTLALASGCAVSIRLNRGQSHPGSFVCRLVRRLLGVGIQIELLSPEFRFRKTKFQAAPSQDPVWDTVMAFGDDATIDVIRSSVPESTRVIGHGEAIAVSMIHLKNLEANLPEILRDTLSLMQQGCMSSRLLGIFVPPEVSAARLADGVQEVLQKQWWSAWGEALPDRHQAGILLRSLGQKTLRWPGRGLPVVQVALDAEPATFGPQIRVCPILAGTPVQDVMENWRKAWPQIKLLTLPSEIQSSNFPPGIDVRPLGRANQPAWDGLHFGQPIFLPS